jgi:hypothetical protein
LSRKYPKICRYAGTEKNRAGPDAVTVSVKGVCYFFLKMGRVPFCPVPDKRERRNDDYRGTESQTACIRLWQGYGHFAGAIFFGPDQRRPADLVAAGPGIHQINPFRSQGGSAAEQLNLLR